MNQLVFNLAEGERRKREGMGRAAENRFHVLRLARAYAKAIAQEKGTVTVDDVYLRLSDWPRSVLGNAAGSIFKSKEWEWTGRFVKSKRASNHARMIREWKLKARVK